MGGCSAIAAMVGLQECSDLHIPFVALGVMWKVFFLVLGMGAIVDHVNGGLLAPESPHWAMGAIVDFFYRRPSGPGKPTLATTKSCCSAGSLEKGYRARRYTVPRVSPCGIYGGVAWGPGQGEGPTIKKSNYQRFDNSIPL